MRFDDAASTVHQSLAVGIVPDSFLLLNVPDEMLVERVAGGLLRTSTRPTLNQRPESGCLYEQLH